MTLPKLLLVDDEKDLVWVIRYYLEHHGYEVLTAHDGVEGLQMAMEHRPDLILLDINIPRLNGLQVRRELRQSPEFASTPVLFLSVRIDVGYPAPGVVDGGDECLTKPFSLGELEARIKCMHLRCHPQRSSEYCSAE